MGIMETGLHVEGMVCQMLFHEESMALLRSVYADYRARVFQLCRLRHRLAESECKAERLKF